MTDNDKTVIVTQSNKVSDLIGVVLNNTYEIDEHIATGGMGEVYKGHNIETHDLVAIKIVLRELARDEMIRSLFIKEAQILGRLSHDAIVQYHLFARDPQIDRTFLAMEFVDGEALADHLKTAPLTFDEARDLTVRVASGLAAAHQAGVIHRDLSPDNVIICEGDVNKAKIIDFGIAKSTNFGGKTIIGNKFAGKENFVSPEQTGLYEHKVTEKADIYSLGLVITAALRGEELDMGGTNFEVMEKRKKVPELHDVDPRFKPLLELMLQPDPDDRPESMSAVVDYVESISDLAAPEVMTGPGSPAGGVDPAPVSHPGPVSGHPRNPSWQPGGEPPSVAPVQPSAPPYGDAEDAGGTTTSAHPQAVFGEDSAAAPPPDGSLGTSSHPTTESPFGPYVPEATPDPAPPSGEDKSRRRGPGLIGFLAAAMVLAVVAGGGLYLSGFFDADEGKQKLAGKADRSGPAPGRSPASGEETPGRPDPAAPSAPQDVAGNTTATEPPRPVERESLTRTTQALGRIPERLDWVAQYRGGSCFFAAVTELNDKAVKIEGFGNQVAPFERLHKEFSELYGISPDIGVRLIDERQCPVTYFLDYIRGLGEQAPDLKLNKDVMKSGEPIAGELKNVLRHTVDLLLIDNEGIIYNISSHLRRSGEEARFDIGLNLATDTAVPQIILAITTADGLDSAKLTAPGYVGPTLNAIQREIEQKQLTAAAKAQYFKIGG